MSSSSLASRAVSGFPLSIGTGIAFETIFNTIQPVYDPDRKVPDKVNIKQFNELWINVGTLFRNMVGSLDKETEINSISPIEYARALLEEIDVIDSLLKNEGNNATQLVLYFSNYKKITDKLKGTPVMLRVDTTDKQKMYTDIMFKTLNELFKLKPDILKLDDVITPKKSFCDALIITHFSIDLLHYKKFNKLLLLESHTGTVKTHHQFYTKYYNGKELPPLPFTKKLFYIFGDSEVIKPMLIGVRKLILEIADSSKWTAVTTDDKVMFDLNNKLRDRFIYKMIQDM